jgi:bla regulator protein blaR1
MPWNRPSEAMKDASPGRRLLLTTLGMVAVATQLLFGVMTASQEPVPLATSKPAQFDAASIKQSRMAAIAGSGFRVSEGRLLAVNATVEDLVRFAYGMEPGDKKSIVGGPRWISSDRFAIEGKAEGKASAAGLREMLRSLLADRFTLRVHEETRERDVYALTLARNDKKFGPRLKPTAADESAHCASLEGESSPTPEFMPDGTRRCSASFRGGMKLRGRPLADLSDMLGELVGRPVVDRTGLTQRFDADLDAALNWDHLVVGGVSDTLGINAAIFTALREQLGLKLEPARGPVRTIVIDSVERPTAD